MMGRPRLMTVCMDVNEYIEYWGAELYNDFCAALGIVPMTYWTWAAHTRKHGVDWWQRDLALEDVKVFPPAEEYRMCVRAAHPQEADGPNRLRHYVAKRTVGMSVEQGRFMLEHELGGMNDMEWLRNTLRYLARREARADGQQSARSEG